MYKTTKWADEKLPEGAELVCIRGKWWLVLWDGNTVIASPDADKWVLPAEDYAATECYYPRDRVEAKLLDDIDKEARAEAQKARRKRKTKRTA